MPSITWLTDKVGVTENGVYVLVGKLFDHTGTEAEHRVGPDEAAIAIGHEKVASALGKQALQIKDLGVPVG